MLLRLYAAMRRLNSVLDVPTSRDRRDLSGPRKYWPLQLKFKFSRVIKGNRKISLVTAYAKRAGAKKSENADDGG